MGQRNYPGTTSTEISARELASQKIARRAAAEGMVPKCVEAGNDLIMPGSKSDIQEILDALDAKKDLSLSMESLDACCRRILSMILQLTT